MAKRERKNPATKFLQQAQSRSIQELIEGYARYLLSEAGAFLLPVELDRVLAHFNIPKRVVGLAGQRALTTPDLIILVEEGDRQTVQSFSTAHELMELLYIALDHGDGAHVSDDVFAAFKTSKEEWCERGAAELVMPRQLVLPEVQLLDPGLGGGGYLAQRCGVSLTAALRRLLELKEVHGAVVVWRYGHSSRQYVPSRLGQSNFFGDLTAMDPPPKLRVARVYPGLDVYIPLEKSVEDTTHIYQAFANGGESRGVDMLDLGTVKGSFYTESLLVTWSGEPVVLSVLIPQFVPRRSRRNSDKVGVDFWRLP